MYESFFGMEHTPLRIGNPFHIHRLSGMSLLKNCSNPMLSGKLSAVWLMWRTARCLLL